MFRLSSLILLLSLVWTGAAARSADAAPQRRVVLTTIGPGDEVWEKYGHNMIELRGERGFGEDVAYHWGVFDFNEPGFVSRFVQGRMTYSMGVVPTVPVIGEYRLQNRVATMQEIPLSETEIDQLLYLCEVNRLPANAKYKYDYFKDNCSTRVRDMLDRVTKGKLKATVDAQTPATPMSYRQHSLRLMRDDLLISLGIDFALGPSCDRPLTAWEECFLPMRLAKYAAPMTATLPPPYTATRPSEREDVPNRLLGMTLTGVALAGAIVLLGTRRHRIARGVAGTIAVVWWVLSGIGGAFGLFLWFLTDHTAGYANQNGLHFSVLGWVVVGLIVAVIVKRRRHANSLAAATPVASASGEGVKTDVRSGPARLLHAVLATILLISVAGLILKLLGILSQDNLRMIGLALPLNLAAAWWAWRLTGAAATDEVTIKP